MIANTYNRLEVSAFSSQPVKKLLQRRAGRQAGRQAAKPEDKKTERLAGRQAGRQAGKTSKLAERRSHRLIQSVRLKLLHSSTSITSSSMTDRDRNGSHILVLHVKGNSVGSDLFS